MIEWLRDMVNIFIKEKEVLPKMRRRVSYAVRDLNAYRHFWRITGDWAMATGEPQMLFKHKDEAEKYIEEIHTIGQKYYRETRFEIVEIEVAWPLAIDAFGNVEDWCN